MNDMLKADNYSNEYVKMDKDDEDTPEVSNLDEIGLGKDEKKRKSILQNGKVVGFGGGNLDLSERAHFDRPGLSGRYFWRRYEHKNKDLIIYKNYHNFYQIFGYFTFVCFFVIFSIFVIVTLFIIVVQFSVEFGWIFLLVHFMINLFVVPIYFVGIYMINFDYAVIVFNKRDNMIEVLRRRFVFKKSVDFVDKVCIVKIERQKFYDVRKLFYLGLMVLLWALTWFFHVYILILIIIYIFVTILNISERYVIKTTQGNDITIVDWETNLFQDQEYIARAFKKDINKIFQLEENSKDSDDDENSDDDYSRMKRRGVSGMFRNVKYIFSHL